MHTLSLPTAAPLPVAAPASDRHPSQRLIDVFRRDVASARRGLRQSSRAATLPPIDDLYEACAPEGALYVDGVLFGSR